MQHLEVDVYRVWDRSVRWFHWINVLTVLTLLGIGLVIYNGSALGISGEGKVLLKELHVWVGYLFVLNLLWRVVHGFRGSRFARWRAVLPFTRGYMDDLRDFARSRRSGEHRYYLGHNPVGKLMVLLLFLLLLAMATTGIVLAGTDIYYPPLGSWIAGWVAAAGVEPATLVPGDKSMVDAAAWEAMRAFRAPFIEVHEVGFFILIGAIILHVAAVVAAEVRERVGLVSAMFSGDKALPKPPVDGPDGEK